MFCTFTVNYWNLLRFEQYLRWLFIVFFVQICIHDSGYSVYRITKIFSSIMSVLLTIGPMAEVVA